MVVGHVLLPERDGGRSAAGPERQGPPGLMLAPGWAALSQAAEASAGRHGLRGQRGGDRLRPLGDGGVLRG
eukprot:8318243-Lingulodinium_polyedra.AAC.1